MDEQTAREAELTALVMKLAERLYLCFEILANLAERRTRAKPQGDDDGSNDRD